MFKLIKQITSFKINHCVKLKFQPIILKKSFHLNHPLRTVLFPDRENNYVFNILQKLPPVTASDVNPVKNVQEFEALLQKNWRLSSASEIVKTFKGVTDFCKNNNIKLSDRRFDKLVDGLLDNCEYLTDNEILDMIYVLAKMPPCQSISDHNYCDLWSCLDDLCCWKISQWPLEKQFQFADAWFRLKLGRLSDFVYELLNRMARRAGRLTKDEILRYYFYTNISRRRAVEFDFEDNLVKLVNSLNVDEFAVVALGYFKSQTKIKLPIILEKMIKEVKENSKTINEISLTAILKILRFSQRYDLYDQYSPMLDKLVDEIPRLSLQCCLHIALMGTGLQFYHEKTLNLCCERIIENIQQVRLKEIERILLATTMFNFEPQTSKPFYQTCFEEIHKTNRWSEIIQFNRCVPAALNYFAIKQLFSEQLMNYVLDEEFIEEIYGKQAKLFPNELLCLDAVADIEFKQYKGNRLEPWRKYKAAKWLIEYIPQYNQQKRLTAADKILLDIVDHLNVIIGKDNVRLDHILPHFCRSDIILCKDKDKGFIEPFGFQRYVLGDIKWPYLQKNLIWYALIILVPNTISRNENQPLGSQIMKARQLKKLGYYTNFVKSTDYCDLNEEEKKAYLWKQIMEADRGEIGG